VKCVKTKQKEYKRFRITWCTDVNRQEETMSKRRPSGDNCSVRKKPSGDTVIEFSDYFHNSEFVTQISQAFKQKTNYSHKESGAELDMNPFPHCVLSDLIKGHNFLDGLKDELLDLVYFEKNNDLYKFSQSDDLKTAKTPYISALRKFLYGECLEWLKGVTGIELNDTVDMTCARYDSTDILLCHDDELEGRRIAYILYLVPSWRKQDGGALELFNTYDNGQPDAVVKSIVPAWNNFVFFEVTPVSFHQVAEVLTEDKTRLSISGWFHGESVPRPARYIDPAPHLLSPGDVEEKLVYDWINPKYLEAKVQVQIREKFKAESQIELKDFLKEDKYEALCEALRGGDLEWRMRGPANIRHYEVCADLPPPVQQCLQLLQSEAVFLTLSNVTGLSLHALAPESDSDEGDSSDEMEASEKLKRNKTEKVKNPRCRSEVCRWRHGSYTVVYDDRNDTSEFALDAKLFINTQNYDAACGGYTSYIAKGEDEELLTVYPAENSLALVYRDKETLHFVKHVNSKVLDMRPHSQFHDICVVYYE